MLDETGLQVATVCLDGRRARTLRTRQRLIKAYLGLLRSAKSTPTGADIAKRAGNSARSLFERFPNRAELNQAAATYVMAQEAKALFVPPGSDRRSRMERCIQSNLKAHERWWPLWRAYMLSPEHAESLGWTFERLRNKRMKEFEAGFHPELSALPASAQRPTAIAVEIMTSIESWGCLKHRHGLSDASIREIWFVSMDKLLSASPASALPGQAA